MILRSAEMAMLEHTSTNVAARPMPRPLTASVVTVSYTHLDVYKRQERIRRITGYLVGTLDRFNDAKRAEEHDRVKHGMQH